jgi:sulfur-oxidizing protein SoxZ
MNPKPRVKLPEAIKAGDLVEVKTLISHIMETGQRKDNDGKVVPRNIIHTFTATFDGNPVFDAKLQPGIAANPYLAFWVRIPSSGTLELTWIDDVGPQVVETIKIEVV